ncbi:MAG TPA: NUDIX hydrolase [Baekduia sp.]|nr:NUDIX hydrolase [Baekduia sp.]
MSDNVGEATPGGLRVTASRTVYENHWMRVREDETVLPDGSPGLYAVVEKPPGAVIVPLDGDHLWLVEQFRHPVGARFWELPQGAWHDRPDARAEDIARGELAEETGLRAATMERLGRLFFAYGLLDQFFDVWRASDLTRGEQDLEPGEQGLVVGRHRVADVRAMVRDGRIADSATVAALGLAGLL